MIVSCQHCGKDFNCTSRRYNFNIKKGFKIYCSRECNHKDKIKNIIVRCNYCGKEVIKKQYNLNKTKSGNYYCNKSCANSINNSLYKVGEKHPNFINGRSSYRNIKLRDSNYCCENCGITDKRVIEVHHIDRDRTNNKLENLKILCANCHLIEHYEERKLKNGVSGR